MLTVYSACVTDLPHTPSSEHHTSDDLTAANLVTLLGDWATFHTPVEDFF